MNFLQKISPEWSLRLGLGLVYLYSGYNLLFYPAGWVWAIPGWFSKIVSQVLPLESYLRMQGGVEIVMALIFIVWFAPRKLVLAAAAFSSLEFLFILLFAPQFSITFRDIGLLGAAIALFLINLSWTKSLST